MPAVYKLLGNLPKSPEGKTGWPWTEASDPLPERMPDGSPWPKISIVTPSYNQAQYLEETIRSVLLQNYPNLEYIIIDGGSTDGSVEIIKKYEPWLTYWVSEKDRGQPHAINKGFEISTGEIMAWINSDDYFACNVFEEIAKAFTNHRTLWVAGLCKTIQTDGSIVDDWHEPEHHLVNWFFSSLYAQPSIFWRRSLWEKSSRIDDALQYSFDYELWLQFVKHQPFPLWIEKNLSFFRVHEKSKSMQKSGEFVKENWVIFNRHIKLVPKGERYKTIIKKRELMANFYLTKANDPHSLFLRGIIGLSYAPWYLFRHYFNYKIINCFRTNKQNNTN